MAEIPSDIRVLATELVKRVNDETRRTRLLEQKVDRFEAELSNVESAISAQNQEAKAKLESIERGIKSISDRIMVIEGAVSRIEKDLAKRATKGELKQIESYMDLMSPITSRFVTREEMERAINEKVVKKY